MKKDMYEYLRKNDKKDENFIAINSRIKQKNMQKKRLYSFIVFIICVIIIGVSTPTIYAKIELQKKYDEYTRRDYVSGKGILASSYSENIDMDYVYQNNIGVKIDSIVLTDDTFKANINIVLPEEMRVDKLPENQDAYVSYEYGFAVYDENNNIYACANRSYGLEFPENYSDYIVCLYKELGIKKSLFEEEVPYLASSAGQGMVEINDNNIILSLSINNNQGGFPNSEKLYIRIFNIGYYCYTENVEEEYYSEYSDLEWIFEIESPERFIKRENINLKLEEDIPVLEISKFTISETGMILNGKQSEITDTMAEGKDMDNWSEVQDALLNITDSDGNIYYPVEFGGSTSDASFHSRFEIDKDLFNETTLYLNIKIGDTEYSSKIIQE